MAKKISLDKFKSVAETQCETEVNQATRETMKIVQNTLNKGKAIDSTEDRERK